MVVIVMIPFFLQFETRDPKVNEIVTLACMSGLAIASRLAFAPLPQIKPMAAVVILTGICFGAESGFLAGALAVLLSNFYFGQGIWTPYQMFGMALVGCGAGLAFYGSRWLRWRLPVCIYGGLATFLLYGVVVNLSYILIPGQSITLSYVLSVYVTALPFDLIHAASTVVFLFIMLRPCMRILERVKVKYGIYGK
jgi:energy-coupling factor transport system substrate-specific component